MAEEPQESVTVQEYNDVQVQAARQHLIIINSLIQKVINLEKAVEELKK